MKTINLFESLIEDLDAQIQECGLPTNSYYVYGLEYAKKMVRKYLKDGWIVVDKNTHLDEKDHMSMYFLTIENDEGFRRTVIARYDCVDGCFKHYTNNQKIAGKCIAYKEYCLPTPYEGDRHE